MNKYIIIPGCSDLNRGDQALVWETKQLAEQCGYIGEYYLTSEKNEPVEQSKKAGLKIIPPILEHPSRKFKSKENIQYTVSLKLKWGIVSIFDFLWSLFLFFAPTRAIAKQLMSDEKREAIKIFEQASAIFMKGGGLLQTYGGFSATYSMYFWTYPIFLASALKKKIFIMPNSFGPFKGPFVKQIASSALKKCTLVTSRESFSQKMVKKELGIDIDNFPDLAFFLSKRELNRSALFVKYGIPEERKLVAITIRPYRFPSALEPHKAYESFKQEMASFIRWLYEQEFMPIIIEHTLSVNAHENDGACIKDVTALLPSECFRLISDQSYDCYDLKFIYSCCQYIVGTRFHSVIFSFDNNVPGIAISYTGNKSTGIMHDIGLDDYVIQIDDVTFPKLKERFEQLCKNEADVVEKIKNYRIDAEQRYTKLQERIKQ